MVRQSSAGRERARAPPQRTAIVAARQDTPLRVAVISDIHANLHALEAVLEAIDADPPDEIWCLGDLVGYGPRRTSAARWSGARATSASSATTTSACSAGSTSTTSTGRRRRRALDADRARSTSTARSSRASRPRRRSTAPSSTTRARATRSGSTCSTRGGRPRRARVDAGAARPRRAQPRRARDRARRRARRRAASRPSGTEIDLAGGPLAPQPGLGRPAARRRPAGGLARCSTSTRGTARFRRVAYDVERTQAEIAERGLPERARRAARARGLERST